MPLFEFQCRKCQAITEVLWQRVDSQSQSVACAQCGSRATAKVISRVSFNLAKATKYSEEFLHKARPFLRTQSQSAQAFAEGKGSDDAKTFQLAEQIGERIDHALKTRLPPTRRG